MYKKLALDLVKQNKAYYCFCTKEQLQQQRDQALAHGLTPKYNRACLQLSPQEVQQKIEAKTQAVIRLKMPDNVNIE
jgi:glutamyl/glutaminyl-tRNA synthetase